jgi:hypothetical protein
MRYSYCCCSSAKSEFNSCCREDRRRDDSAALSNTSVRYVLGKFEMLGSVGAGDLRQLCGVVALVERLCLVTSYWGK